MSIETLKFDHLKKANLLPKVRTRVGEVGLALAMSEMFQQAGITIEFNGDISAWESPSQPVMAVGDHSQGLESLLVIGASGLAGRGDIGVTAKPYALTGQVVNAFSGDNDNHLIGLIPGNMATDRSGGDFGVRAHKALFRSRLPANQDETRTYNARSMRRAADLIEAGSLVTIFPTGGVYDAATTPWRQGVGQLALTLEPETFDETLVSQFKFDGVSPRRILQAILKSRLGLKSKPQTIIMNLGRQETLGEIFKESPATTAQQVTEVLQARYMEEFDRQA